MQQARAQSSFTWFRQFVDTLLGPFRMPKRRQVAALCYRRRKKGVEVLLVSSRGRGRWILPKGNPELGSTPEKMAAREALEEAGAVGKVRREPFMRCAAGKGLGSGIEVATDTDVYLLEVAELKDSFAEAGQRKRRWLPVDEAIETVDDAGFRDALVAFRARLAAAAPAAKSGE